MVVGIDEVGRGCIAGPLVVGVVALDEAIDGLKDSKLLSQSKRLTIARSVYAKAKVAVLGWVWPEEIDRLGLTKATSLAMVRALALITKPIDNIIIDGNYNYLPRQNNVQTVIGADKTIDCVSAASVIAKVARDNYMHSIANYLADYGFSQHVGYATKLHLKQLETYQPSVFHRRSTLPVAVYFEKN